MNKAPSLRPVGPLLERLPPGPRERLLRIGDEGRGIFGAARFQSIFEAHLDLFEYLAAAGATALAIGHLLAEVGIRREDGTPLPSRSSEYSRRAWHRSAGLVVILP